MNRLSRLVGLLAAHLDHASWLNQIEIYFSVSGESCLPSTTFLTLMCLPINSPAFETRYNCAAQPFDWRFDRNDLNRLLTWIAG